MAIDTEYRRAYRKPFTRNENIPACVERLPVPTSPEMHNNLETSNFLKEKGTFEILIDDKDKMFIVIDGQAHSPKEFLEILKINEGSKLSYKIEDSSPRMHNLWISKAEHFPKDLFSE